MIPPDSTLTSLSFVVHILAYITFKKLLPYNDGTCHPNQKNQIYLCYPKINESVYYQCQVSEQKQVRGSIYIPAYRFLQKTVLTCYLSDILSFSRTNNIIPVIRKTRTYSSKGSSAISSTLTITGVLLILLNSSGHS